MDPQSMTARNRQTGRHQVVCGGSRRVQDDPEVAAQVRQALRPGVHAQRRRLAQQQLRALRHKILRPLRHVAQRLMLQFLP